MINKDFRLIKSCLELSQVEWLQLQENMKYMEFPLDSSVVKIFHDDLCPKISQDADDYEIFKYSDKLQEIWLLLIEKSIKCLRYFDEREPFQRQSEKKPQAYGLNDLKTYFKKYNSFESVLYASNNYRDHVVHVFRTWLSGLKSMLDKDGEYLKAMRFAEQAKDGFGDKFQINNWEKLSIWTLIALTHDLGYPLEKAKEIIINTKQMLSSFIANPNVSIDLSFHGVQNYMNDFIVRLISSKMEYRKCHTNIFHIKKYLGNNRSYVVRLQSKYYFKFLKSLENSKHGIISAIIIYKLLTYFLESDYSIHEDYSFSQEDGRQFYIRREILRSIASHTCKDIYQMHMCSFSFLLIIMDDCQEWGRKYISELYLEPKRNYGLPDVELKIEPGKNNKCNITEDFSIRGEQSAVKELLERLEKQCKGYIKIFRDGQETKNRDFSFRKNCNIECIDSSENIQVIFDIPNTKSPSFIVNIISKEDEKTKYKFEKKFFEELFFRAKGNKVIDDSYKNTDSGYSITVPLDE